MEPYKGRKGPQIVGTTSPQRLQCWAHWPAAHHRMARQERTHRNGTAWVRRMGRNSAPSLSEAGCAVCWTKNTNNSRSRVLALCAQRTAHLGRIFSTEAQPALCMRSSSPGAEPQRWRCRARQRTLGGWSPRLCCPPPPRYAAPAGTRSLSSREERPCFKQALPEGGARFGGSAGLRAVKSSSRGRHSSRAPLAVCAWQKGSEPGME